MPFRNRALAKFDHRSLKCNFQLFKILLKWIEYGDLLQKYAPWGLEIFYIWKNALFNAQSFLKVLTCLPCTLLLELTFSFEDTFSRFFLSLKILGNAF